MNEDLFDRSPTGLKAAVSSKPVRLSNEDTYELRIRPVRKKIGNATVRMLGYNGMIPGPLLVVDRGSQVTVTVSNEADLETTVHWHGLRLKNAFDGVPNYTQDPIPVGGQYSYRLDFPDEGIFWYHPHLREDYSQELGLYGNILVVPSDADYWSPVDREVVITLDDLLLENGKIAPFSRRHTNRAAMGRYGNVFLVDGRTDWSLQTRQGEVVRFFLTNTANSRTFNLSMSGAVMKLVGGDSGRVEEEELVDEVLLSPSERAVIDVLFNQAGTVVLQSRTPEKIYELGAVTVNATDTTALREERFFKLRHFAAFDDERRRLPYEVQRAADKTILLDGSMMMPEHSMSEHSMSEHSMSEHSMPAGGSSDARLPGVAPATMTEIEWEDDMPQMNAMTTSANMVWSITDSETGLSNDQIDWVFRRGDRVKIRIVNRIDSDHPMQHPIHFHGQRLLVLRRNDDLNRNLVWKDSVLVKTGEVVEVLMDASNPGSWMVHCHIAEHFESGMMFSFRVDQRA